MMMREIGKTGKLQSVLGFGCMRFPQNSENTEDINLDKTFEMLDYAVENGVTYFDTAYGYHGGASEKVVGAYFASRGKGAMSIATKLPVWLVKEPADMERLFLEQLERLQQPKVEYYLLHALNKKTWDNIVAMGGLEFIAKLKAEGRVDYVGFSFHDEYSTFEPIVDAFPWDFCQVQLNYLDIEHQAGMKGMLYARSKGLGIVIMEPLRGGSIVANVPDDIMSLWGDKSPVAWAFDYLYDMPEVDICLSGMSTLEQVKENIEIARDAQVGKLTQVQQDTILEVAQKYHERTRNGCTECAYCMPCPHGVNIPRAFRLYNMAYRYSQPTDYRQAYSQMPDDQKASQCIACGLCEPKCPQNIAIINDLIAAHEELTKA